MRSILTLAFGMTTLLGLAGSSRADLPMARLNTLDPPGAKQGTTVDMILGGVDLEGLTGLYFGRPGITAALVSGVTFKVTVPADMPLGPIDVRAVGAWGISNPRTFWIGDLTEQKEVEPNNEIAKANEVPIDGVVNGRMDARADVDFFKFKAPAGRRVVIDVLAQRIDSRLNPVLTLYDPAGKQVELVQNYTGDDPLMDFVAPAAGDYTVRLHDLTYNGSAEYFYRLRIHTKPVVEFAYPPVVKPGASQPVVLFGRNLPGGKPDPAAHFRGRPLDALAVNVQAPGEPEKRLALDTDLFLLPRQASLDGFSYRLPGVATNPVLIGLSELPLVMDKEANDLETTAQVFTPPCELVGRFDKEGDSDWYRFTAKKGQTFSLEGFSERLGYVSDLSVIARRILPPAAGQAAGTINAQDIGEYDDNALNVGRFKFQTNSHDPLVTFTAPEDGDYLLQVTDKFASFRGDGRTLYRVQIGPVIPDFRLAVVAANENDPASALVRQGGTAYVHVFAMRQGGFAGEIKVEATGLPAGVTAPPVIMGPGINEVPLVFKAEENAANVAGPVTIVGTATIDSKPAVRQARSGTVIWTAAATVPKPARLAQSFCLAVRENSPYMLNIAPLQATFAQGSQLSLALTLQRRYPDFTAALTGVTALNIPANVVNQAVNVAEKQNNGLLHLFFANNVAPGTYSFIVAGTGQVPFTKTPQDPKAAKANIAVADPSLPITVTIVPAAVQLAANPPAPTVKPGEKVKVKVTVTRVNNYNGPVTLGLTVPPGVAGISAPAVTVAPEQKEGELEIAVAANVAPADIAFATVRATSTVNNQPVTSDAQLTIKVVK